MRLKELINGDWDNIWIVSHTVPDIDSMSSLTLMKIYLQWNTSSTIKPILNRDIISKINQQKFLDLYSCLLGKTYNVPDKIGRNDLLILVDEQWGEGNTPYIEGVTGRNLVTIDHHITTNQIPCLFKDVRPNRCSTTSVLYKYVEPLKEAAPIVLDLVYHGMYSDTNGFKNKLNSEDAKIRYALEVVTPINRESIWETYREEYGVEDVKHLIKALNTYKKFEGFILTKINKCDTNTLGSIADILASIQGNDVVIVYFEDKDECKARLSVRSHCIEVSAHKVIKKITGKVGNGGGHLHACAGYIDLNQIGNTHNYIVNTLKDFKVRGN